VWQYGDQSALVATRRLDDHARRVELEPVAGQTTDRVALVGHGMDFALGSCTPLQLVFRDIDPDALTQW
jgi:hypothetical protein